jgi:hypothetical protein
MCCRFWRVLHPLLTFAAVACCAWLVWKERQRSYLEGDSGLGKPEQNDQRPTSQRKVLHTDTALRTLLNAKSVGGDYQLPEGENYGGIALLWFEDGRFRGRRASLEFPGTPDGVRAVSYQFLWGEGPDRKTRVVGLLSYPPDGLFTDVSPIETDDFFAKLDIASGMTPSRPAEEVRGYRILTHLSSRKGRGGVGQPMESSTCAHAIESRQTVLVVGVKTFPTFNQASDWYLAREPAGV